MDSFIYRVREAITLALFGALFTTAAPARADMLYVANGSNSTIEKFTSGGVGAVFASTGSSFPIGLAFDSAGNLYVANNSTIEKFTPGGVGAVFASTGSGSPTGLAFDSAGNLYTSYFSNSTIEKFTPGGVGSVFSGSGLNHPEGLAFDSAGNLYAANQGDNTIEKFTPGGVASVFATTGLSNPLGVAFDSAGNLYAANYISNTIEKFTPGGVGSVFANSIGPSGVAFDSGGNLYAANLSNNTIEKFTPAGIGSVFASSGLNTPQYLAFTNDAGMPLPLPIVPEPSNLAILYLGIPALLIFRRRKSKPHWRKGTRTQPMISHSLGRREMPDQRQGRALKAPRVADSSVASCSQEIACFQFNSATARKDLAHVTYS